MLYDCDFYRKNSNYIRNIELILTDSKELINKLTFKTIVRHFSLNQNNN